MKEINDRIIKLFNIYTKSAGFREFLLSNIDKRIRSSDEWKSINRNTLGLQDFNRPKIDLISIAGDEVKINSDNLGDLFNPASPEKDLEFLKNYIISSTKTSVGTDILSFSIILLSTAISNSFPTWINALLTNGDSLVILKVGDGYTVFRVPPQYAGDTNNNFLSKCLTGLDKDIAQDILRYISINF